MWWCRREQKREKEELGQSVEERRDTWSVVRSFCDAQWSETEIDADNILQTFRWSLLDTRGREDIGNKILGL